MFEQAKFLDALRFAASCSAVKDIRYYLNGVLFEVRPDRLTLVATDDHRIAVIEQAVETGGLNTDLIISGIDVKLLLTAIKRETLPGLSLKVVDSALIVTDRAGRDWPLIPVEGKFPDWRRIAPKPELEATKVVGLNAKYLAAAATACEKISSKKIAIVKIELRGGSSIVKFEPEHHGYTEAYIAVMPSRL